MKNEVKTAPLGPNGLENSFELSGRQDVTGQEYRSSLLIGERLDKRFGFFVEVSKRELGPCISEVLRA